MNELEKFIEKIENFDKLSPSEKISYFMFYLTEIKKFNSARSIDIENCFNELRLKKYSNIPAYLTNQAKLKKPIIIKQNGQYFLERSTIKKISKIVEKPIQHNPSNNFIPLTILLNTRGYIERILYQAISCYDLGLYDACLILTRKLLELLIIECFEKNKLESKIKDNNNDYYFLSNLIIEYLKEYNWTLSRNTKKSLPIIKKYADLSAHNRRFFAKKQDIEKIQDDLRIIIEELVHIIDYPNWN